MTTNVCDNDERLLTFRSISWT